MKELSFGKVLGFFIIFLFLFSLTAMKITGSMTSGNQVELTGYCKIVYGDSWSFSKETNSCFNKVNYSTSPYLITQTLFFEICPNNELFSDSFYSVCFKAGRTFP